MFDTRLRHAQPHTARIAFASYVWRDVVWAGSYTVPIWTTGMLRNATRCVLALSPSRPAMGEYIRFVKSTPGW